MDGSGKSTPNKYKKGGGPTWETIKVASRLLINCRTIYNIHNIVNANISLVLHVNKHIVRQKANNGTRAVCM